MGRNKERELPVTITDEKDPDRGKQIYYCQLKLSWMLKNKDKKTLK